MTASDRSLELLPGSPRCYCTVCGHIFLTHVSFDAHRGIVASDDEGHQDQGWCWDAERMEYEGLIQVGDWVWGNAAEVQQLEKFEAMRQMRGTK